MFLLLRTPQLLLITRTPPQTRYCFCCCRNTHDDSLLGPQQKPGEVFAAAEAAMTTHPAKLLLLLLSSNYDSLAGPLKTRWGFGAAEPTIKSHYACPSRPSKFLLLRQQQLRLTPQTRQTRQDFGCCWSTNYDSLPTPPQNRRCFLMLREQQWLLTTRTPPPRPSNVFAAARTAITTPYPDAPQTRRGLCCCGSNNYDSPAPVKTRHGFCCCWSTNYDSLSTPPHTRRCFCCCGRSNDY